ncbi:sulfite oxidase-like oxidoreductase [Streptomyces sp. VRA16 Mangrove soil]|uniref:sulfite oxidase-like oxidoreductase n=1 Tax=Streptomyces sp. VRA16 Mangrove soil TaxID=2817434 RepID=UPI001A9EE81D|nr:sulfite oxidase-like oxidoreductase [Streptomyces sp. VRA16 Mangrove soil]MBO1335718.1 sulfite oxidase-like oxidoreductase [Streptomyces sp. VRA16 Mangrove soil]
MASLSPGFHGRSSRSLVDRLPPGQYPTESFPVLSAGPTPHVPTERWSFTVTSETGASRSWTWEEMTALPQEQPVVDIHCVTRWSKFDTRWQGVSLDVLTDAVRTSADFVVAESFDGYTTNLPRADITGGRAWLVHSFDGYPLSPDHGGPARLLIPHLYFWKSAKWVRGLRFTTDNEPGFWERAGYHDYGDPWREQRYRGDL